MTKEHRHTVNQHTIQPGQPAPLEARPTRPNRLWLLLLLLPYAALCFPGLYARATPALFGIPFFYWYQFAWVIVTSCLLGVAYRILRDEAAPQESTPPTKDAPGSN